MPQIDPTVQKSMSWRRIVQGITFETFNKNDGDNQQKLLNLGKPVTV